MEKQKGAVAIMVGLSLVMLIGFLALVLDLGHVYLVKTGLQNGADAAALAGAMELNGTANGVKAARDRAIELARENDFGFNQPVGTDDADGGLGIYVGDCPEDSCMSAIASITTDALAAGMTFLKVETGPRAMGAWFANVFSLVGGNLDQLATYAVAVAGRFTISITPMGVCAINPADKEQGFLRGVAYNLPDLNPLHNGDPIWLNPVDPYPGTCDPNHGNTPNLAPFACTGKSTTINSTSGEVWVNTGSQSAINGPLNSRFGDNYSGGQACDPVSAPPDTNVKEFFCTQASNPNKDTYCLNNPGPRSPETWMDPNTAAPTIPYHQSIETSSTKQGKPFYADSGRTSPETPADFSRYGVLWSYSKEVDLSTAAPYNEYGVNDWTKLYGGAVQNYPAGSSPYLSFIDPPSGPGAPYKRANRRVLNLAIINCQGVTDIPGQQCKMHLPVLAIGKFFMQRRADLPNHLTAEFAGTFGITTPLAEIRLYR